MSMYKEYRREPSIPHQCMHHRYKTGDRCRGRAMHNEVMCFQHRIEDLPTVLQNAPFELTSLYDRASIQRVVTEVAARLACNHMDLKRAALLLQSCQIAAANLTAHDRAARAAALAPKITAVPLTPPTQELDPNPDPEALVRYQTYQAELGLDDEDEEEEESATEPVILSERSESKDPDEPQTASTPNTILPKTPDPQPPTDNENSQRTQSSPPSAPQPHPTRHEVPSTTPGSATHPTRSVQDGTKYRSVQNGTKCPTLNASDSRCPTLSPPVTKHGETAAAAPGSPPAVSPALHEPRAAAPAAVQPPQAESETSPPAPWKSGRPSTPGRPGSASRNPARGAHLRLMLQHHLPDLRDPGVIERRASHNLRRPSVARRRKQVQRRRIFNPRALRLRQVVAVCFVDRHPVDHLDDAALDPLQLVARASQHQQQKKIRHRPHRSFRLPHANRLDKNVAVSRRLAQQNRLSRPPRHAAQMSARRRRPNERQWLRRKPLHPRLIAQNAAARDRARRIHASAPRAARRGRASHAFPAHR